MADIQYDPACVRCRIDAGRDVAGTTWQCYPHVQAERDSLWLALAEATRERDDATAAANIRAAEHRKERDLRAQAEIERDEARALAVLWAREFNVANHERLRLWDEAESFREKLDQFEANGFPNVASVLDRIAVLSRARETDGAVSEAKERLWDALDRESLGGTYLAARGLRAALSSPPRPETKAPRECGGRCHDAIDSRSPCPECAAEMHGPELVPRPAPPADAATEAAREVIDAWQAAQDARLNVPIRLASALFRLSALPAPAPSAKEGRT